MSDTLGSLFDKLSIVNIKLWFALEGFRSEDKNVVYEAVKKHNVLNVQRNALIKEIDEKVNHLVATGQTQLLQDATKSYGAK